MSIPGRRSYDKDESVQVYDGLLVYFSSELLSCFACNSLSEDDVQMLLEAKMSASSRRGIVNSDQVLVTH